jgi:carbohydrate kinase (thermoresistant glucokinase family)
MGVSGVGKTTIGVDLASALSATFLDADSLHSDENISKMKNGNSLSDADRGPWLLKINSVLIELTKNENNIVLACSALKESYRKKLLKNIKTYLVIYLYADFEMIMSRLSERKNHFFTPSLLNSQIAILEPPKKGFIAQDANKARKYIIQEILYKISAQL